MSKLLKYILIIFVITSFESFAKENFFNEAKNLFDKGKYEESKFLFQRNIVFNPKDAKSYLYLAKIYNSEENEREEETGCPTSGYGRKPEKPKGGFGYAGKRTDQDQ